MSGGSRGYPAFQQLESVAETYQLDNSPPHAQQPQHLLGRASQPFMALEDEILVQQEMQQQQ